MEAPATAAKPKFLRMVMVAVLIVALYFIAVTILGLDQGLRGVAEDMRNAAP